MMIWRCEVCGYLHEGKEPPGSCPKCAASRDKFKLLDEEEAEIMQDAMLTKEKYSQILEKLDEVSQLAAEGMLLDLDDGCNKIFNKARDDIESLQKMIRDELAGHAGQCIWIKVASDGDLP